RHVFARLPLALDEVDRRIDVAIRLPDVHADEALLLLGQLGHIVEVFEELFLGGVAHDGELEQTRNRHASSSGGALIGSFGRAHRLTSCGGPAGVSTAAGVDSSAGHPSGGSHRFTNASMASRVKGLSMKSSAPAPSATRGPAA